MNVHRVLVHWLSVLILAAFLKPAKMVPARFKVYTPQCLISPTTAISSIRLKTRVLGITNGLRCPRGLQYAVSLHPLHLFIFRDGRNHSCALVYATIFEQKVDNMCPAAKGAHDNSVSAKSFGNIWLAGTKLSRNEPGRKVLLIPGVCKTAKSARRVVFGVKGPLGTIV